MDYYLLVENRCVSDCLSIADTKSILFYDTRNVSTLEMKYTISISRFYWAQTSQNIASLAQQSLTKNAASSTKNLASTTTRVQPINNSSASTLSSISTLSSNGSQNSNFTVSSISLTQSSSILPSPNFNASSASNSLKTSTILITDSAMASFHSSS